MKRYYISCCMNQSVPAALLTTARRIPLLDHVLPFLAMGLLFIAALTGGANPALSDGRDGVVRKDPARDERLPPVIPGEVVKGADGSEIKVWSSSGPVPSGQVPAAPSLPGGSTTGGALGQAGVGGVIVDSRRLLPDTLLPDTGGSQNLPLLEK